MRNPFRRGLHRANKFRPTVAEIAASIKANPFRLDHRGRLVATFPVTLWAPPGSDNSSSVVLSIAPPPGVANFPALIESR